MRVLKQWFSYRRANRERPLIGDKRPPSRLETIRPDHWLPEYTTDLLDVLNVLGLLVDVDSRAGKRARRHHWRPDHLARPTPGCGRPQPARRLPDETVPWPGSVDEALRLVS